MSRSSIAPGLTRASLPLVCLSLAGASTAFAKGPTPKTAADASGAEVIAIVGATVHTGSGDVIEEATLVLRDGRIAEMGKDVRPPENARAINGKGKVVTPGLISVDTPLGLVEIEGVEQTVDGQPDADPVRSALRAVDAYNPRSTLLPIARSGGITTTVSMPSGGLISGVGLSADLVHGGGYETILDPHAALGIHLGARGGASVGGSRALALARLREVFDDAKALQGGRKAFDRNQLRPLEASRTDLEALFGALKGEHPLLVHADRAQDISATLAFAKEYGFRVVISGGAEAWMVADELAAAQVPVIIDPMSNLPGDFDTLGARADSARLLREGGVDVILTGGEAHNARNLRFHAGNAVRAGLPHGQAIEAITRAPAEAFGLAPDRGTLKVGAVANLVLWDGDPLELSTFPEWVVIQGRTPRSTTRQDRLLERYCAGHCRRSRPPSQEDRERKSKPRSDG